MGEFLKNVLLFLIGTTSGVVIAAGLYAFLVVIGTVTRLVSRTETSKHIKLYEDVMVLGATCGNILYIFEYAPPLSIIGVIIFGLFSGVFVGCLASALAETIEAMPVFAQRVKLKVGLPYMVLAIGLGKCIGTIYQLCIS